MNTLEKFIWYSIFVLCLMWSVGSTTVLTHTQKASSNIETLDRNNQAVKNVHNPSKYG